MTKHLSHGDTLVEIDDVELCVETFGDPAHPAVLLMVVYGDHDPFPPFPPLPHGQAVRDAIPGAQLLILQGAGHDLPQPLWSVFAAALIQHTAGGRP